MYIKSYSACVLTGSYSHLIGWWFCYQMCTSPRDSGSGTFIRTIVPDNRIAIPLIKLLEHYRWSLVGILVEESQMWTLRAKHMSTYFGANGIKVGLQKTITSSYAYNRTQHQSQLRAALKNLKSNANSKWF